MMNKGTIIRTAVLVIALVNQALVISGNSPLPFEDAEIERFVSTIITIGASLATWWKNNSFTKEAQEADAILRSKKAVK